MVRLRHRRRVDYVDVPKEYADQVQEICDLYNTAEADLKNVGRIKDTLIVTGVNQLRYAGQHLSRALAGTDSDKINDNLISAAKHAKRAIFDVNDSAIHFYLTRINHIRTKDFPRVDFSSIVDQYGEVQKAIREAREHLDITEESQSDREKYYETAREHVHRLKDAHDTIESYRDDFVSQAKNQNSKRLATWASFAATFLGLVLFVFIRACSTS